MSAVSSDANRAVGAATALKVRAPWRSLAFAFAAAAAIVAGYWPTAASMVAIWQRSETFSHGFAVVPIALWLIWRRRHATAQVPPRPYAPALLLVAAAGFGWLLGRLAGAAVVQHFALVLMIQSAAVAVLGLQGARTIAFPLLFLFFAVPFGEALVPWLIDRTADFTVAALKLTGVPVYREGNHFVIPTGQWSVVEACSGLRYLVASLMAGTLYAYLMYASAWRRAAFIAVSVLVPLVANWLRAYLIVMLGHLSGNELAVGVDHLIYGWIFFGLVIALMFWIGARYRDDAVPAATAPAVGADTGASRVALAASAAVAVVVAGLWSPLAAALADAGRWHPRPLAPIEGVAGWTPVVAPEGPWQPRFTGHRASLRQTFERDGRRVELYVAYYAAQTEGYEMVNSKNVLVPADDPVWRETMRGQTVIPGGAAPIRARTARIAGPNGGYDVVWWYWVDGRTAASDGLAKAWQAWSRLMLRPDSSAAVFVFTEAAARADGGDALRSFVADMSESIERALLAARAGQRR
jgi:exosortase A